MIENRLHPVDCVYVERNLIQYHEQALPVPSIKAVRAHIETCDSCAQSLTEYRQLEGMLFADAVHYRQTDTFSAEAQKRVQRNVYRRVRWRMLGRRDKRPFLSYPPHPAYGLAAVLFLIIGIMTHQNIQLSNQYTTLEAKHAALVADNDDVSTKYIELNHDVRRVNAKVARAAGDWLVTSEDSTSIFEGDLDKLLLVAVANSDVSAVQEILHAGAEIDVTDSIGRTPLIYAIDRRNPRMIDTLLDWETTPNIDAKTETVGTPLYRAYRIAKEHGDTSLFEWLLDEGADLNAPAIGETTIWSILLSNGDSELVQMMLDRGVDVDEVVLYDRTPLMLAAATGHKDIVSMLLEAGADRTVITEEGKMAAQLAWEENYFETAILIFNFGHVNELEFEFDFDHPRIQQFVAKPESLTEMTFDNSMIQQLAMVFSHPHVIHARQQ